MIKAYAGYLLVSLVPMFFLFFSIMALEGIAFWKTRRPAKPYMMVVMSLESFACYIILSIVIFREISCRY